MVWAFPNNQGHQIWTQDRGLVQQMDSQPMVISNLDLGVIATSNPLKRALNTLFQRTPDLQKQPYSSYDHITRNLPYINLKGIRNPLKGTLCLPSSSLMARFASEAMQGALSSTDGLGPNSDIHVYLPRYRYTYLYIHIYTIYVHIYV